MRRFHKLSLITIFVLGLITGLPGADLPPGAKESASPFQPPERFRNDFGTYKSPLIFDDGRPVRSAADWTERRREILKTWHSLMGEWPPMIGDPALTRFESNRRDGFTQTRVRLKVAPDRATDGYLLIPDGPGPFPAMLTVYYEPETAVGLGKTTQRDFALRLVRKGFAALSIGFDPRVIDPNMSEIKIQPLSYLAYVAANAYEAFATVPQVDPKRIGVMGHSYGGKWAMFAAALYDKFACGVWSDPGVAFDEARSNVNYWEPWYLGWEPGKTRKPGVITNANPRTGAYRRMMETGRDLHEILALTAPRPFLVSGGAEDGPERWKALNHAVAVNRLLGAENRVAMTYRPGHTPTEESNEQIDRFLIDVLKPSRKANGPR